MKTNKQLLSKSEQIQELQKMVSLPAIVLADEEADRFIDYVVDESVLKNNARIIKMKKETKNVRALGLGEKRFLYPGDTFNSEDYLRRLAEMKIPLVTKKLRGCVQIHDDDLEDNIEADAFADHIMRMVTSRIGNELDEIFWIGDTGSLSGFANVDSRSRFDGWRYRMRMSQALTGYLSGHYNKVTGNATMMTAFAETGWTTGQAFTQGQVIHPTAIPNGRVYIMTNASGTTHAATEPVWANCATIGSTIIDGTVTWRCHAYDCALAGLIAQQNTGVPYNWEFKYGNMLKKLPSKYKKAGLANLRFFQSDQLAQDYVNALSARATILGDKAIVGGGPLVYGQVPIVPCPLMPMTMSATGAAGAGFYGDTLLTHKDNLVIGIQRNIKIESQRVPADEATYWFYSMRADCGIENVNACLLMEKLITT